MAHLEEPLWQEEEPHVEYDPRGVRYAVLGCVAFWALVAAAWVAL